MISRRDVELIFYLVTDFDHVVIGLRMQNTFYRRKFVSGLACFLEEQE